MTAVVRTSSVFAPHATPTERHVQQQHSHSDSEAGGWDTYRNLDPKLKESSGSLVLESESDDDFDYEGYMATTPIPGSAGECREGEEGGESEGAATRRTEALSASSSAASFAQASDTSSVAGPRLKPKKRLHCTYVPFSLSQDPSFTPKEGGTREGASTSTSTEENTDEQGPTYSPMCHDGLDNMTVEELRAYLAHTRAEMNAVSGDLVALLLLNDRLTNENEALNASTAQVSKALITEASSTPRTSGPRKTGRIRASSLLSVRSALWYVRSKKRQQAVSTVAESGSDVVRANTEVCLETTESDVVPRAVSYTEGERR